MTVAQKGTEISEDLAENFYVNSSLNTIKTPNGATWLCVKSGGAIRASVGQNGSAINYIYDSSICDTDITSSSTGAEIKTSVKAWINSQVYNELQLPNQNTKLAKE